MEIERTQHNLGQIMQQGYGPKRQPPHGHTTKRRPENIYPQSDGGCRGNRYSGTGYRIATIDENGNPHNTTVAGRYYNENMSSLKVDALALLNTTENLLSKTTDASH